MADVEVYGADIADGTVKTLRVRFKGARERTINRETALEWLAGGHSMITYSGSSHHGHRGHAIERVEIGETAFLRTDTKQVAADELHFPGHGH